MSNTYQMQARSTTTGRIITWVYVGSSPDNMGLEWPGPGSPEYIASTLYVGLSTPAVAVAAPLAIVPATGPATGGTHVVIQVASSAGLVRATIGADLDNFAIDDPTHVSGDTVAGAVGADPVTVGTANGTSTPLVDGFTYEASPVPTVVSLDHDLGDTLGGNTVVITGTNLAAASAVKFGATNATSYVVNSPTQITAVAPAHAAGSGPVTVTTPGGTSVGSAYEFWSPAEQTPTAFWDGGNYVVGPSWPTRSRSYATALNLGLLVGETAPMADVNGCPLFVKASSTAMGRGTDNMQAVLGNGDFTIAVRVNIVSVSVQANVDLLDGLLVDLQLYVGLMLKQTGGGAYEAWFLGYDSAERYVHATVGLGAWDIIVKRESGTLYMTVDGGANWVTGDALGTISGGLGFVMGKNTYGASHGGNGYLDATVKAAMVNQATESTALANKWKRWASAMHP